MLIAIAITLHPTDGTILIARRRSDVHLSDLWEFPGGKCRADETPADCAVRETWEETGLNVMVLEAWPPITYAYPERTVTLHPFLCRAETADAQPLASREIVWARPDDLPRYPFPEANGPLLKRLACLPTPP